MKKILITALISLGLFFSLNSNAQQPWKKILSVNEAASPGWRVSSANNQYELYFQTDGNLVVYRKASGSTPARVVWSAYKTGGTKLILQYDSNLILFSGTTAIWASGSVFPVESVLIPPFLALDDAGSVMVFGWGGSVRWTSPNDPMTRTYSIPAYEPSYWNNDAYIRQNNNCYNYANNKKTNTFAQPGRAHGVSGYAMNVTAVRNAAIADGLVPTDSSAASPEGKAKIALVVAPNLDYHWYRQDSDGRWTHKPGQTAATNVDQSGVTISNPEWANRGPYTDFGGYFFTPSNSVQGQGQAVIQ